MVKEFNEEYEKLIEASNKYHDAFHDYLEKYGFDDKLTQESEIKIAWINMKAFQNKISLDRLY